MSDRFFVAVTHIVLERFADFFLSMDVGNSESDVVGRATPRPFRSANCEFRGVTELAMRHAKGGDAVDKLFSHLAVDAALDQLLLSLAPEDMSVEVRALAWLAAMSVQFFLVRRWVLSWAGLEAETETEKTQNLDAVAA